MTNEDRIIAAELVIGLLAGEAEVQARERAAVEPAFAREVDWWHERLAPLLVQTRELPPPPYLRDRIIARLDIPMAAPRRPSHKWRWAGLGGAIGALAASVATFLLTPSVWTTLPQQPVPVTRPSKVLVASLMWSTGSKTPSPIAVLDPADNTLRLSSAVSVAKDRVGQLWRIPAGGTPVSLGLIPSAVGSRLLLSPAVAPIQGETLAVSVEPIGGSPTGQPTGPVILTGSLINV